jgi:hypothetical protein
MTKKVPERILIITNGFLKNRKKNNGNNYYNSDAFIRISDLLDTFHLNRKRR